MRICPVLGWVGLCSWLALGFADGRGVRVIESGLRVVLDIRVVVARATASRTSRWSSLRWVSGFSSTWKWTLKALWASCLWLVRAWKLIAVEF